MASAAIPQQIELAARQLDDLTECPICTEIYTDPRVLPCIHTYCLPCIDKWGRDKVKDGKLACPLCRKKIAVPVGGFVELPKNFFMEKLIEVRRLTSRLSAKETAACDVCKEDLEKRDGAKTSAATVYCIDCRRNMCAQCNKWHQKFSGQHNLVDLEKRGTDDRDLLLKFPENMCDKHPDKNLEIYCFECKFAACMMCYITAHNAHKCADVKQVAAEMKTGMKTDADGILKHISECKSAIKELKVQMDTFAEMADTVEEDINQRAECLKQRIEDEKLKLLDEVVNCRKRKVKELENARDELERSLTMMESFVRYSDEMRSKGTACDVARAADSLHERALDLMSLNAHREFSEHEYISTAVSFSAVSADHCKLSAIFGQLCVGDNSQEDLSSSKGTFKPSSTPRSTIPGLGSGVSAITSLKDQLFLVRHEAKHINVYNAETFVRQNRLRVPGFIANHCGLAACNRHKCVYVSAHDADKLFRIELKGGNTVTSWSVGRSPYGLSVSDASNVLVACAGVGEIQEYTTFGLLVKKIVLERGVNYPLNVIQLPGDQFGVTHGRSLQRFCVVDQDGKAVKIDGNAWGSGIIGQMNSPFGLSVRNLNAVFVADMENNGVLMLDMSTEPIQSETLTVDGGLHSPSCVHYDKTRDRLYIVEAAGNKRVVVLEQ